MHKTLANLVQGEFPQDVSDDSWDQFFNALSKILHDHDLSRSSLEDKLEQITRELQKANTFIEDQRCEFDKAKVQLEEIVARQDILLDATPEAVLSFSREGKVIKINRTAERCFNLESHKLLCLSPKSVFQFFLKKFESSPNLIADILSLKNANMTELNGYIQYEDGHFFEYHSVPEILNSEYIGRLWCFRDITDIKHHQELLKHQATHDALTNLPNRNLIISSLRHSINRAKRHDRRVAIIFIDLDDFKKINDTVGHTAGDKFLVRMAKAMGKILRDCDLIGRIGGDEFLIVLEEIEQPEDIELILQRLLLIFKQPIIVENKEFVVSCSIGVSTYPNDSDDAEQLVRKADMAMYQAKSEGKNTFRRFNQRLERCAQQRLHVENQLRETISSPEFSLAFQPRIAITTGETVSAEALIRWVRPNGETIYPDRFITIAEQIGLIGFITQWVLDEACRTLTSWQGTILENIELSINISAKDMQNKHFAKQVLDTISKYPIEPSKLEFEITETVFLKEKDYVRKTVGVLKEAGIKFSIDDFGTGYSNFGYLRDLDIDFLKIDRSFVTGVYQNPRSMAIIRSIIDVGTNLGMSIVAEGIEFDEDLSFLKTIGCHFGQGYLFSKPIPEQQLFQILLPVH